MSQYNRRQLKSLGRSPSGETTYTQGEPVFTRTIHIVGRKPITLPPMALYKVRWNVRNEFSYD